MTDIIAADIGGTNARFTRASLDDKGVPTLGTVRKYKVADYPSLQACWGAFVEDESKDSDTPLPDAASIAFATAIGREVIKLTNSNWVIRADTLAEDLGLRTVRLVNDFEAVAHAVSRLPDENLPLLFGEDRPFPRDGGVTVVGPGTGLGVAMIAYDDGHPHVIATEGGHLDFAPLDQIEVKILDYLRDKFLRVSTERIVSGPGLNYIYKALATIGHDRVMLMEDPELWQAALERQRGVRPPRARPLLPLLWLGRGRSGTGARPPCGGTGRRPHPADEGFSRTERLPHPLQGQGPVREPDGDRADPLCDP